VFEHHILQALFHTSRRYSDGSAARAFSSQACVGDCPQPAYATGRLRDGDGRTIGATSKVEGRRTSDPAYGPRGDVGGERARGLRPKGQRGFSKNPCWGTLNLFNATQIAHAGGASSMFMAHLTLENTRNGGVCPVGVGIRGMVRFLRRRGHGQGKALILGGVAETFVALNRGPRVQAMEI
jgi:hypothetical protein